MKKIMVIRAYGAEWDCELYMLTDRTAKRVERLWEIFEPIEAYKLARAEDKTSEEQRKRKDWRSLDTIDFLMQYLPDEIL